MWHFAKAPIAVIPKELAEKMKLGAFAGHLGSGFITGFSAYTEGVAFKAPAPKATLSDDSTSLTIESQRGATMYQVCISTSVTVTLPDGEVSSGVLNMGPEKYEARFRTDAPKEFRVHRFWGPAEGPLKLKLKRKDNSKTPLAIWVGDIAPGVASVASEFNKARGPYSVEFHHGDRSLVGKWIKHKP